MVEIGDTLRAKHLGKFRGSRELAAGGLKATRLFEREPIGKAYYLSSLSPPVSKQSSPFKVRAHNDSDPSRYSSPVGTSILPIAGH